MPRLCSVCSHPEREAIDHALIEGGSLRDIARRFSTVSKDGLHRHRAHLPSAMVVARDDAALLHGDSLVAKVRALEAQARAIGQRAEAAGDLRVALSAVRELIRIAELQAKLAGQLSEAPTVNVTLSPDWVALRTAILGALTLHPDARIAVAAALDGGTPG